MATVNLGRIRQIWRGTWATGTAYVKDDVVLSGVNSYICVTAHTAGATFAGDSANWELMVQGTDLPAQSGNANKVLLTDGTNLSWGDGGKLVQTVRAQSTAHTSSGYTVQTLVNATVTNSNGTNICEVSITPQYSDSIIFASAACSAGIPNNARGYCSLFISNQLVAMPTGNGYAADADNFACSGSISAGTTNTIGVYYRLLGGWSGESMYLGGIQNVQTVANPITATLTVMELRP